MTTSLDPLTFEILLGKLAADRQAVADLAEKRPGLYSTADIVAYLGDVGFTRRETELAGQQLEDDKTKIRKALSDIFDCLTRERALFRKGLDASVNRGRR